MMGASLFYAPLRILSKKDNPFRIKEAKIWKSPSMRELGRIEETIPKSRCPSYDLLSTLQSAAQLQAHQRYSTPLAQGQP